MMRKTLMPGVLALTIALVSGCSSAPDVEEQNALQAMREAENLKAAVYAPDAWRAAEDTLQAARGEKAAQDGRFAPFRNYGEAKALYQRTTTLARQASTVAEAQRVVVRQEAETLLTEASGALDALSSRLAKMRGGKDTKAEIEMMKQDVAALRQQWEEARVELDQGNFDGAKTKAQTIIDKISALRETIRATTTSVSGNRHA
jgi:hypothetical protein